MSTRTRLLIVLAVVALMVVAFAVPAFAQPNWIVGHESLYAKTPTASGPWTVNPDGASGKLMYKLCYLNMPMQFVFNGHGLVPAVDYSLVNYKGWSDVVVLGTGVANEFGDVHIAGGSDSILGPDASDPSFEGVKIWLVPTSQLSGNAMVWSADWFTTVLFEGAGISLR